MRKFLPPILIFFVSFIPWVWADSGTPAPSVTVTVAPPTAISLPDIPSQAESFASLKASLLKELSDNIVLSSISAELSDTTKRVDDLSKELPKGTAALSLERVKDLHSSWESLRAVLSDEARRVRDFASFLENNKTHLNDLIPIWKQTLSQVQQSKGPKDVAFRVENALNDISATIQKVDQKLDDALLVQNRIADQDARVGSALGTLAVLHEQAVSNLLEKNAPPIWSSQTAEARRLILQQTEDSFQNQIDAAGEYLFQNFGSVVFHSLIIISLLLALRRIKKKVGPTTFFLKATIATAFLLSLLARDVFYPQAPRLFIAIINGIALLPTLVLLRHLVKKECFKPFYLLIVFYLFDQLRFISSGVPLVSRLLLLGEIVIGLVSFSLLLPALMKSRGEHKSRDPILFLSNIGVRLSVVSFGISLVAASIGYVRLAAFLCDAVLQASYLGVILYTSVCILEGLISLALRIPFLAKLHIVKGNKLVIEKTITIGLHLLGYAAWVYYTLDQLSIRGPFFHMLGHYLDTAITIGSISLSLSGVVVFALTLYLTVLFSRLARFVLEEEVFPRFYLPRGIPYAISTLIHYVILVVGFVLAAAALGFDMTKFTILMSALGVGLGFGLQNIVNNFVSGLILLFERPIKIGDVIQLSDTEGTVERIGIRASVIRTQTGSKLIVPNGKLIAEPVTNWTFSGRSRSFHLSVAIASAADPNQVLFILDEISKKNEGVLPSPEPRAIVARLGADYVLYELHGWTNRFDDWDVLKSELFVALLHECNAKGIELKNLP